MNKELQKQKVIARMKMLGIYAATIREFEKETIINKFEHGGFLYWLDKNEQKMARVFEEKHNALVYHVIHNYTEFGELYSLLYVSKHKDEWDYDKYDIKSNLAIAYEKPLCSSFIFSLALKLSSAS